MHLFNIFNLRYHDYYSVNFLSEIIVIRLFLISFQRKKKEKAANQFRSFFTKKENRPVIEVRTKIFHKIHSHIVAMEIVGLEFIGFLLPAWNRRLSIQKEHR